MAKRTYEQWRQLLSHEALPTALIDLDAVDHNLRVLERALDASKTIRLASKSVRHPWLMKYILGRGDVDSGAGAGRAPMRGIMTFSAHETEFLFEQGFDDFLAGYPVGLEEDARVYARLVAAGARVIPTIDSLEHIPLMEGAAAAEGVELPVCIDIDMSWRPLDKLHLGVRRSPVRTVDDARRVARAVGDSGHLRLEALLAYEAQIAGIRERNPGSQLLDPIRRMIKRRSRPVVLKRRAEVLDGLRQDGHRVAIVNGGGTGSIHFTSSDPSVTEVTIGSGFVCSHLFTGYDKLPLHPAAFFAIPVVRKPGEGHVTCAGGGYMASGPPARDRAPVVHAPQGLRTLAMEGWGEVQTPFAASDGTPLRLGDPVIARHAKAGELAERFDQYLLVRGHKIVGREPTYRGLGKTFM